MGGARLLKPDMSHIETWPDLFVDGETMIAHRWDLSDREEVIGEAIANYDAMLEIAREGQERYRRHTAGTEAGALFAARVQGLIAEAEAARARAGAHGSAATDSTAATDGTAATDRTAATTIETA